MIMRKKPHIVTESRLHTSAETNFKQALGLVCAAGLLINRFAMAADEPAAPVRLTGIICFSTNTFALLEDPAARPSHELLLKEGQRVGRLTVIRIEPAEGKVEIHNEGVFSELTFTPEQTAGSTTNVVADPAAKPSVFLRLRQAGGPVLYFYQLLTHRTVIPSPSLPPFRLDLQPKDAHSEADLAQAIEQALAEKGILIRPVRENFAVAVTERDLLKITPDLWASASNLYNPPSLPIAASGADRSLPTPAPADEIIPPGLIDFLGADINQLEAIYQDLAGRTLLRPVAPAPASVWLRTATPLSRTEALFAFHLVLALNDISLLPAGEKLALVFPTSDMSKARALLGRTMPTHAIADPKTLAPWTMDLRGTGLAEITKLYERLCGQPVSIEAGLANPQLALNNKTPLTPVEALYALDLLLAWHGLAVVPQEDGKSLKLARSAH